MASGMSSVPCTNDLMARAVRLGALPLDMGAYLSTLHGTPCEADALRVALSAALGRLELTAASEKRLVDMVDRFLAGAQ